MLSEASRFKSLYFFLYGAYGVLMPYMSIFFDVLSMNKVQIGILSMIPNVCCFLVAPLFSVIGDKFKAHGELMIISVIVATTAQYLMQFLKSFESLSLVVVICSVFRSPLGPQVDSMVISTLEDKSTFGSFRLWGAIGFGISSFVGGYLTTTTSSNEYSEDVIPDGSIRNGMDNGQENEEQHGSVETFQFLFFIHAIFCLFAGLVILSQVYVNIQKAHALQITQFLKQNQRLEKGDRNNSDITVSMSSYSNSVDKTNGTSCDNKFTIVGDDEDKEENTNDENNRRSSSTINSINNSTNNSTGNDNGDGDEAIPVDGVILTVARVFYYNPSVTIFALVVFLSGIGSGVIDVFLFLRLKQLGASGLVMGISRFITCAAEVPMFQVAGYLQKKYGTWPVMLLTQIAFVFRFTYYSLLINPWWVLPCEVLHGLTFATMWNVSCTYASEISPPGCNSTMQALLEGLHWGVGSGLGALIGGFMYDSFGAVKLFEYSAVISVVSTVLSALACRYCSTVVRYGTENHSTSASVIGGRNQNDDEMGRSTHGLVELVDRTEFTKFASGGGGGGGSVYSKLSETDEAV